MTPHQVPFVLRRIVAISLFCGALQVACQADRGALMAALASPDPIARAKAVQKLADRKDPNDLGFLIGRVSDPDPQVRESVAAAFGSFDDRRAVEALAGLASDPVESVQLLAVRSLARQKSPRANTYLLVAYEQGDVAVRAGVIDGLVSSGRDPAEAVRAEARSTWLRLSKALSLGSTAERIAAAEGLGRSGRPEAVERLASYLGADSPWLAIAAARGLGASGSAEARVPLEALLTDESVDLRIAGAEALGRLGNVESSASLARLAAQGGRAGVSAVEALERLLTPEGASPPSRASSQLDRQVFCAALLVDDEEVAARMARLSRSIGVSCDVRPLIARARLASSAGRAALSALVELDPKGDPGAASVLSEVLRSGSPSSKPLAAKLAGRIALPSLRPTLEKVFSDGAVQLKRARQRWIPAPKGSEVADSLFSDEPPDLVATYAEAGLALVRLGGPEATTTANALADDFDARVRGRAAEAALSLSPVAGWPLLQRLLEDPALPVRDRALESLASFDRNSAEPGRWLVSALRQGDGRADELTLIALLAQRQPSADAVDVLARALRRPDTAGAAADALRGQDRALVEPILLARLGEQPNAGLVELVSAASALHLDAALPSLRPLRFHPRPEVASATATALWKLEPQHAQADLAPLADAYHQELRRAAAGVPPG